MRRDQLCPKPEYCAEAQIEAQEASEEDLGPCETCPLERLNRYLESARGRAVACIVDLDFALQTGFAVALGEVGYYEFCLLRMLADERKRYEVEEIERKRHGR